MFIKFAPFVPLPGLYIPMSVSREGETLIVSGVSFDLSPLSEGSVLPAEAISSEWFEGELVRIEGQLHLTLRLPVPPNAKGSVSFPDPVRVTKDGPVRLPTDEVTQ